MAPPSSTSRVDAIRMVFILGIGVLGAVFLIIGFFWSSHSNGVLIGILLIVLAIFGERLTFFGFRGLAMRGSAPTYPRNRRRRPR